jgi:phospholipid-binding lipoprotein MlaA
MAFSLASFALLVSSAPAALVMQPQAVALAQGASQQKQGSEEPVDSSPPVESENVIVVTGEGADPLKDPLESVNIQAYELTRDIDKAFVEPIADVYEEDLPSPIRKGLRNFLRNLMEPVNALNYLLQLKPGKALETVGRFAINTTVGMAGLFDVAKKEPFNLPYRRNGFGNTLGYYGVGPGPFLVLPLVGATTLRDLLGSGIDQAIIPFAVGKPFNTPYYAIPAYTVNSLEFRIEFDERIGQINDSDDPYYALRESYLCNREADIAALKNQPPPRDCSIEAIMRGPEPADSLIPQDSPEVEPTAGPVAVEPPPQPPAIIYISEEVVQPLPADYR